MIGIEPLDSLYVVSMKVCSKRATLATHTNYKPCHESLDHRDNKTLHESLSYIVRVNENEVDNKKESYRPCVVGRSVGTSRKSRPNGIFDRMTSQSVERIHTDVGGPVKWISLGMARYSVTAVHEHSGFSLVRFININRDSEPFIAVTQTIRDIENFSNLKMETMKFLDQKIVKWVQFDGDGEYVEHQFRDWLKHCTIVHEVTAGFSPEWKGRAKRLNRSLMDKAQTIMQAKPNAKYELWAGAVNTACCMHNWRMTRSSKHNCMSYEVIYCKNPDVSRYSAFWCKAYVFKLQHWREGKLDRLAENGILVGYCCGDGFRFLMNNETRAVETKDVRCDE